MALVNQCKVFHTKFLESMLNFEMVKAKIIHVVKKSAHVKREINIKLPLQALML